MSSGDSPIERFKRVTSATMRAIAERDDITANFSPSGRGLQGTEARLPMPARDLPPEDIALVRGEADSIALRLRHHDSGVHAAQQPTDGEARSVFDAVEQARCEALGMRRMSGCTLNLDAALEENYRSRGLNQVSDHNDVPLSEVLRLMAREAISSKPLPPSAQRLVESWRNHLDPQIFRDIDALQQTAGDQEEYARQVRQMLQHLDMDAGSEPEPNEDQSESEQEGQDNAGDDNQTRGEGGEEDSDESESSQSSEMEDQDSGEGQEGEEAVESEGETDEGEGAEEPGSPNRPPEWDDRRNSIPQEAYRAFTTEFDEVVDAASLCDPDELQRLRQLLDQQLAHLQGVIARLANRLQRRLMAKQTRAWEFNLEEGLLDSARLARIIADPTHSLTYKHEKDTDFRDTVVTLLIDNSGSMRGRPISVAAMSADILARTLERCGVKVEVLGFTTRMWKGGQARERWVSAGKPALPGRLNDLRHIVYKSADDPWRRARKNLGLMLREGILKENIDGEALLWAHNRLIARPEARRVLMVISDGAPVDDSTLSVNPGNYLEKHLREVIEYIETRSPVQLTAIGIGHDVTRYYKRAVTIVDAEQLGGAMLERLAELFDEPEIQDARQRKAQKRRAG
ncbi:cobaltochelatase subunit CobT [Fodinicurvata fenggangensis]|uniref:cobaltochelatase subunit CobT n=1 Tax=Fodinicurvata fenggangensis TaxID=1121830 RepID=UPI00047D348D|nr:cobaltochelatase subunit CobT [Fodinicurvata fenggangensis]